MALLEWFYGLVCRKEVSFVVLVIQLGLVGDRLGIGLSDMEWMELYVGLPTWRHSHFQMW